MIDGSLARIRPITSIASLWHSSIGKKFVMAVTGLIWFGYLIVHLWGNLKIYGGAAPLNEYAGFLRTAGAPLFGHEQILWLARLILIPAFIVHIVAALQLKRRDQVGRRQAYAARKNLESTLASRTMIWGGVVILLFIIFHVLDLTTGNANPSFIAGDIYHNVVASFSRWYVSLFYVVAMLAVGMHLFHGIWSMFHTLGFNTRRSDRFLRNVATVFALALTIGNISIPFAVLAGLVR
ncbi:MAG: succinate dehydrogenase cytochrome b subunit [Chloroflexi bacterium]|nr:succinate dehydrogenase cytochrome b subunit [Chloroflexota bacterium]